MQSEKHWEDQRLSTESLASSDLHAYKIILDSAMRKCYMSGSHPEHCWHWGQTKLCYGVFGPYQTFSGVFSFYPTDIPQTSHTPNKYEGKRSSKCLLGSKVTLVVIIQRVGRNQEGVLTPANRLWNDNACLEGAYIRRHGCEQKTSKRKSLGEERWSSNTFGNQREGQISYRPGLCYS